MHSYSLTSYICCEHGMYIVRASYMLCASSLLGYYEGNQAGQYGGRVRQKRLPSPGRPELSTQMRPCMASTSCLLIYNPSPVPRVVPARSRLRRTNFSKSRGCSSAGMAGPASCTERYTGEAGVAC